MTKFRDLRLSPEVQAYFQRGTWPLLGMREGRMYRQRSSYNSVLAREWWNLVMGGFYQGELKPRFSVHHGCDL